MRAKPARTLPQRNSTRRWESWGAKYFRTRQNKARVWASIGTTDTCGSNGHELCGHATRFASDRKKQQSCAIRFNFLPHQKPPSWVNPFLTFSCFSLRTQGRALPQVDVYRTYVDAWSWPRRRGVAAERRLEFLAGTSLPCCGQTPKHEIWSKSAQIQSKSIKVGRHRRNLGIIWPCMTETGPRVGRFAPNSDQHRTKFGRTRPTLAQI